MKAITIEPGKAHSILLEEVAEPQEIANSVLVKTHAIGICGTDIELIDGDYGWAPPGKARLVIGHESLGEVLEAPSGSGFTPGDLVVGIVRRPDPVPCSSCAVGQWDMCRNGKYTERGIKQIDGFASERFRCEVEYTIKLDPKLGFAGVLLEPTSVVAKAWDHVERIGQRAAWNPRTALITGAGPVGLLAAMIGRQKGLDVHVLDLPQTGIKPDLVQALGATFHSGSIKSLPFEPDIIIECTGAAAIIVEAMGSAASGGVVCLAGVSSEGHQVSLDIGLLNRSMVLQNEVIFGSVNANRAHWELAAAALAKADLSWLSRLITRRVPLAQWSDAYTRRDGDVKTVLDFLA
jgi:threonine dehydrogenase-like Zn-dependent dehydrogenase